MADKFYIRDLERIQKIRDQIDSGELRRDQVNERDLALVERLEEAEAEDMKQDGAALKYKMRKLKKSIRGMVNTVKDKITEMKEDKEIADGKRPPRPEPTEEDDVISDEEDDKE